MTRGTPGLNYTSDFSCCFFDSENNFWIGTLDRGYSVRYTNEKEFTRSIRLGKQTLSKFVNAVTISKDGHTPGSEAVSRVSWPTPRSST